MGVQERFDVADVDGGPVGLAAVAGQELREVAHRGQPGLERGMPARVGAGAAGAIAASDQVRSEPGHRRPQRFGHRVDAGLPTRGGAAFVPVRRQRQLVRGQEVFQGARQRHVGVDRFQQRLRMHGSTGVRQPLSESGEHGASAAGMVTSDQVGAEVAQPIGWIIQCRGDDWLRAPRSGAASVAQQDRHRPAPASRVTRPQSTQAASGFGGRPGCEHDPHQPVSDRRTLRFPQRGHSTRSASRRCRRTTFLAEVAVDEQHRRVADPAGARAAHAAAGVRLQDPVDAAARAADA